ncbi:MAG TPA: BON domain-containing protein [Kofleriaceae bacterium]|nr:BON domain-containing protein [Kofleriaceae bacterium]
MQIEDEAIEQRINNALAGRFGKDQINVNVTAYNRQVLLAGQVLDEKSKADAEALARVQQNVGNVFNELEVRPIATLSTRSNDTALSGKVRAALVAEQGVPSGTIRVTTENSVVFLMGRVTAAEGDLAARTLPDSAVSLLRVDSVAIGLTSSSLNTLPTFCCTLASASTSDLVLSSRT